MIVDVNVPNLANAINSLKSIISEYEEIELNLFNQLNDSCVNNWQDKYSKEFEGKMQLDKQEAQLILESLNEKKEVYNFIHDRYGEIARKIKVNLSRTICDKTLSRKGDGTLDVEFFLKVITF